jgi:hypothetical protein
MDKDMQRVFEEMHRQRQYAADAHDAIKQLRELERVHGVDLPRIFEELQRQRRSLSGAENAIKQLREVERLHGKDPLRMIEETKQANGLLSNLHGPLLRHTPRSVLSSIAPGIVLAQSFRQAFEPFATTLADAFKRFQADVVEPIRQFQEMLAAIPKEHLEALREIISTATSTFQQQLEEEDKRIFAFLAREGWVGLEDYFTSAEFRRIMRVKKLRGKEGVDLIVCRRFRAHRYRLLTGLIRGWKRIPYLAQRWKIIRQAVKAHKEGGYALSVPCLLPLLDGLSARIVGKTVGRRKAIYAREAAQLYHSTEHEIWSDCVIRVFTSLVYKEYDFAKRPRTVNRHAIIHGEVIGYPTEANSLRVILLINTFARILSSKKLTASP